MCEQDHVFGRDPELACDVPNERVYVLDHLPEGARRTARSRRAAVPALVQGENRNLFQA
jgi:hypothetical protein